MLQCSIEQYGRRLAGNLERPTVGGFYGGSTAGVIGSTFTKTAVEPRGSCGYLELTCKNRFTSSKAVLHDSTAGTGRS